MKQMENIMRSLLTSGAAATALATAALFFPHPAQAMTITTPIGLSAAIQQSEVKQNVYWRRYWGYRPYAYAYAYRPYYAYAYRPYYTYAYRPYYAYAYRPYAYSYYRPYAYGAYAHRGYGPRIWVGWRPRWWW